MFVRVVDKHSNRAVWINPAQVVFFEARDLYRGDAEEVVLYTQTHRISFVRRKRGIAGEQVARELSGGGLGTLRVDKLEVVSWEARIMNL